MTQLDPLKIQRVLITSPSLDEKRNVSGISTLVREIIRCGTNEYIHFPAGRQDNEKVGIPWILRQLALPLRFAAKIVSSNPNSIHINTSFEPLSIYRDFLLTLVSNFLGKPVLLHIHGGRYLVEEMDGTVLNYCAGEMLRGASGILALSSNEKDTLIIRYPGLRVDVLPNAVPLSKFQSGKPENDIPVIIFLGRIHKSKGLETIIHAAKELKEAGKLFQFRCYGTGPDEEKFVSEMTSLLGGSFSFGGVVGGNEKWDALRSADIFLLPSDFEGLPLSLLEAMSCGCIPVVTDVGSIGTLVINGENGFLVERSNVGQVVDKLSYLLENRTQWKDLQTAARSTIVRDFLMDGYVKKLGQIYRDILAI